MPELRHVNPGCRVYVSLLEADVLYEVQKMPSKRLLGSQKFFSTHITVISEKDQSEYSLPPNIQVTICEEDDVLHEYSARCNCIDCQEKRLGVVEGWQDEKDDAVLELTGLEWNTMNIALLHMRNMASKQEQPLFDTLVKRVAAFTANFVHVEDTEKVIVRAIRKEEE